MNPSTRLGELAREVLEVRDHLADAKDRDELPEDLVEEIGTISERLRRASHAAPEAVEVDPEAAMARAEAEAEGRAQARYERHLDNARGRGVRGGPDR